MPDGRVCCCVPFCRRTRKRMRDCVEIEGLTIDLCSEWICVDHWRLVADRTRRLHNMAKRRVRKFQDFRNAMISARLWRRCVREAVEGAAGI